MQSAVKCFALLLFIMYAGFAIVGCKKNNSISDYKGKQNNLTEQFEIKVEIEENISSPNENTIRVRFSWKENPDAISYQIQIAGKSDFSDAQLYETELTKLVVTLPSPSAVYVRIRFLNFDEQESVWSVPFVRSFSLRFNNTFGGSADENGMYAVQLSDEKYIIAGITHSFGIAGEAWLTKTDHLGKKIWSKTYGGSGEERFNQIIETTDKKYLLGGYTTSKGNGGEDGYLIKTDTSGAILWEKTFGGGGNDAILSIDQSSDGMIFCSGYTSSFGDGFQAWILKIDANGNELWKKYYGGNGNDFGQHIEKVEDGIVVSGVNGSISGRFYDFWLFKVDNNGLVIWDKTYGTGSDERAIRFTTTNDGGFAVTGYTDISGNLDFWLVRTNKNGDSLWSKSYGSSGNDFGQSIKSMYDNGFIQTGYTTDAFGNQDLWVVKTNEIGEIIFTKKYGGPGSESGSSIEITRDYGFIIGGWTTSYGLGGRDFWLLKTDKDGNAE